MSRLPFLIGCLLLLQSCGATGDTVASDNIDQDQQHEQQKDKASWQEEYASAKILAFSGDDAQAEQKFTRALAAIESQKGKELTAADIKARLAKLYLKQGHVKTAIPLLESALGVLKTSKVESKEYSELLVLLDDNAELLLYETDSKDANYADRLKLVLDLQESSHTGVHNKTFFVLVKLINYYLGKRDLVEANKYIDEALKLAGKKDVKGLTGKMNMLLNIHFALSDLGYKEDADRVYERTVAIWRKYEPDRADAMLYHSLSHIYREKKQYARADEYARKSLKEARRLNDTSLEVSMLAAEAVSMDRQGKFKEADKLYAEALAAQRKNPGNLSQDLVKRLEQYARFLKKNGQAKRAAGLDAEARGYRAKYIKF